MADENSEGRQLPTDVILFRIHGYCKIAVGAAIVPSGVGLKSEGNVTKPIDHDPSSGNVFSDIGLPDADEHMSKAKLVFKTDALMRERCLKQVDAAKLFGVKQPDVSKMLHSDFRPFSVERLMRFLVALGHDVEIVVKAHRDATVAPAPQVA